MKEQKRLFEIIKSKISDNYRLADVIEELLDISSDSAYRRIRGEKELTFSELQKICKKFDLSMDEVLSSKSDHGAFFHHTPVDLSDQESYVNYMTQLSDKLNINSKLVTGNEFEFTALDIPFYHFTKYPELAFFRLYAWSDTLNHNALSFNDFCNHLEKDRILPIYKQIHHAFVHTPSKEIWTTHTIDTTLRMLEYYFEVGAFNGKDEVLFLLNQLMTLIGSVKQYAERGYKDDDKTPFALYFCSVDVENDFMLIRKGDDLSCLIQLYAINRMITDNEYLCVDTQKWIDSLIIKSILISGNSSYKERRHFFQSMESKIRSLIHKVDKKITAIP